MSYQEFRPGRFQILPPVVKNIIIINIIFFVATIVLGDQMGIDLADKLGLHYFGSEKFRPHQLITYLFMHGGFAHILFNMFAVWMFGSAIENLLGPKRFFIYYLVTGLGAAFLHYALFYFEAKPTLDFLSSYVANPDLELFSEYFNTGKFKVVSEETRDRISDFIPVLNDLASDGNERAALDATVDFVQQYKEDFLSAPVVVGASGAVFGLLIAFGMKFPNSVIYLYFALPIKAKYFVILYGALELYMGIKNNPGDNVAHFAHLGGMLFGFIMIKIWGGGRRKRFDYYE